jgi:hypothetical protein
VLSWRIRALGVLSWRNHLQRADALGVRRVAREDLDEGEAVGMLAGPQPSESRDRKCATIVWPAPRGYALFSAARARFSVHRNVWPEFFHHVMGRHPGRFDTGKSVRAAVRRKAA